jgi:hypothetical protein
VNLKLALFLVVLAFPFASLAEPPTSVKRNEVTATKETGTAQQPAAGDLSSRVAPPKPDDVKSIDSILKAVYDVISGPAGDRDWNRFRSLFVPEARLTSATRKEGGPVRLLDVEGYARGAGSYFKTHAFYESAVVNRVERFGNIAQVFSSYASRNAPNEKPFARGVNSIQLFNDGARWWVISILWDEETPANPLPGDLATPAK